MYISKALYIVLLSILSLSFSASSNALSAGQLANHCQDFENYESLDNQAQIGICAGYIIGALDLWALFSNTDGVFKSEAFEQYPLIQARTCVPSEANRQQRIRVIKKFLDNNPEHHHKAATNVIMMAISDAFCD